MEDKYRDIIRDKFDNLEGVPPIGGWNSIKDHVKKKPSGPRAGFFLIPLGIITAGLLFFGGYYFGSNNAPVISKNNHNSSGLATATPAKDLNNPNGIVSDRTEIQNNNVHSASNTSGNAESLSAQNPTDANLMASNESTYTESIHSSNPAFTNLLNTENQALANQPTGIPVGTSLYSTGNITTTHSSNSNSESNTTLIPPMAGIATGNNGTFSAGSITRNGTDTPSGLTHTQYGGSLEAAIVSHNPNEYGRTPSQINDSEGGIGSHENGNGLTIDSRSTSQGRESGNYPSYGIFAKTFPERDRTIWGSEVVLADMSAGSSEDLDANSAATPEEKENNKSKNTKSSDIKMGVYASLLNNNKNVSTNGNDANYITNYIQTKGMSMKKVGFDLGMNASKRVCKRWVVGVGVGLTQLNDHIEYEMAGAPKISSQKLDDRMIQVSFNETITRKYDLKLNYVGFHTELAYELIKGKVSLVTGLEYSRLAEAQLLDEYNQKVTFNGFNNSNIKSSFGLAYIYPVSAGWNMKIQPTFNYYYGQAILSDFNSKPYNFGLRLNLIRK